MRIALMIEGQEDVSWADWLALAEACEEFGIEALFRSDHYMSFAHADRREAHDAWTTIAALASRTTHVRLGTCVSPATFRHPANLAKTVATIDHVSGGRVELGLGAGWFADEFNAFGFPFPGPAERQDILEEAVEIVCRMWTEESPFSFSGRHFQLDECRSLPQPRAASPPTTDHRRQRRTAERRARRSLGRRIQRQQRRTRHRWSANGHGWLRRARRSAATLHRCDCPCSPTCSSVPTPRISTLAPPA